jgi:hypothetical protein
MFEQLVQQYGGDAVVKNNAIPNEQINETSNSIFAGLQKIASEGGDSQTPLRGPVTSLSLHDMKLEYPEQQRVTMQMEVRIQYPITASGVVQPKSKFGPSEGAADFSDEIYDHPNVTAERQSNGRWKYTVQDLIRSTGTNQAGTAVRGGLVIVESNPAFNSALCNPGEVVTQFPK